jgi:hypothetical protein
MRRQLPPFETVTEPELRSLWTQHGDADVRRLILEVAPYRLVIKELDCSGQVFPDTDYGDQAACCSIAIGDK